MKVALAQMNVKPGQPRKNLEQMLEMAKEAKDNGADIVSFSEECVLGYMVGDKWTEDETVEDLIGYHKVLQKASEHIPIIFGSTYVDPNTELRNKDGRSRKYNAVFAYQDGKPVKRTKDTALPDGIDPKTLLPNYRFFDDVRYFFSKQDFATAHDHKLEDLCQPFVFNIKGEKKLIGTQTCEDMWKEDYIKDGESINTAKYLVENGAEYIVNLSSSPWTVGKNAARDRQVKRTIQEATINGKKNFKGFFYNNNVGAQNNGKNVITFDGATTAYNSDGDPIAFADVREEQILYVDTEEIDSLPVLERKEETPIRQKHMAIIQGLRHMKDSMGQEEHPSWLVGLSGGVDSSVVAPLLVEAFGADKVGGVNYPTKYNGDTLKDVARTLADNLGIKYDVVEIQKPVDLIQKTMESAKHFGKVFNTLSPKATALHYGNMTATLRIGLIHAQLAAANGALYPNCGNKTETLIGYLTLNGDGRGAIGPILDSPKDEVYDIGKDINKLWKEKGWHREVIPREILYPEENPAYEPTAELELEQKDPIHIPLHGPLTAAIMDYRKATPAVILGWYQKGELTKNLQIHHKNDDELLLEAELETPAKFVDNIEWFTKQKDYSVFKRVQAQCGILLSQTAFGYDLRESMLPNNPSEKFRGIKAEILGDDFVPYEEINTAYKQIFTLAA